MSAVAVEPAGAWELRDWELPEELEAHEPPEARGLARDEVRLLAASRGSGRLVHARARDLPRLLSPGDLLVVNTSGTLPAAVSAIRADGTAVALHLSTPLPPGLDETVWVVELRREVGTTSVKLADVRPGETLALPGGGRAEILARSRGHRLWKAALRLPAPLLSYLGRHGRPIRYRHVEREWPLSAYQTAFATEPGSAEMPSAGRALTPELLAALVARGIGVAPLTLHTGVSSLEEHEPPYAERFRVPVETARLVGATRDRGGRVIAVGTTVVRALETAADDEGRVAPAAGWTELVVTPERGVRAVDGLLTGWHELRSSHLRLLDAVGGPELVDRSYRAALGCRYLWHEFGDLHLILP